MDCEIQELLKREDEWKTTRRLCKHDDSEDGRNPEAEHITKIIEANRRLQDLILGYYRQFGE